MRFHLIDRIDSWESGQWISGRKVTSTAETFWQRDPAGHLRMPAELVLETVCQAATWLIMLSSQFAKRAILLSIEEVACLGDVVPGDMLTVTAIVRSMTGEAAVFDGSVTVEGRPVLRSAGLMCALRDAHTLQDADRTERMAQQLLRTGGGR
jgi:3-hydroxyacyl-[acyl-carrier-protein] dehydratase